MRPRPLYRWKFFWFGLLTLSFMVWATDDSRRNFTSINVSNWHWDRIYQVSFFVHSAPRTAGEEFVQREAKPEEDSVGPGLPSMVKTKGLVGVFVPDESVIFPFLFGWTGFLFWRWVRQKQRKESS